MRGGLPRRYARALLALAREANALEATGEDLARAAAAFEEPRLRALLLSPLVDASRRVEISRKVLDALGVARIVANLVALLAERDRLAILSDVARAYETLVDDALGRTRVVIRSAAPLSTAERSQLVELARRLTGRQHVAAKAEVDADLLGGVVLDVGGTVYDGSLRTQLQRLGKEMAERGA